MAQRTPQLAVYNLIQQAGAVITVSSEDTANGFSRYNILDPTPGRYWKSKPGWNVSPGWNNKIYFLEGASARVGTIVTGNYPTPTLYALACQQAMNTAPGATNSYSVGDASNVFTIARTAGASAFSLTFTTANQDSAHLDLGFANTALSGFLTYSSLFAVYKSREYMLFDLSGVAIVSLGWSTVILYGVRDMAVGVFTFPEFYVQYAGAPSFQNNPMVAGDLATYDYLKQPSRAVRQIIGGTGSQYVRFVFDDRRSGNASSQLGVGSIVSVFQPGRSVAQGWGESSDPLTSVSISETGGVFQDPKPQAKTFNLQFRRLSDLDKLELEAIEQFIKIGGSFFYLADPLNALTSDLWYVVLTRPLEYGQAVGDGPTANRWNILMQLRQHL